MSVDKKDFDIDPGSGVGAVPAEEAAAEGSDAKPLRRKSRGLRVPSDNVPRPDGRRTLPPGEVQTAPPVEIPSVVTIMPQRPASAQGGPAVLPVATPPPPAEGGPTRPATEDLEVDLEMIEDDTGMAVAAPRSAAMRARTVTSRSSHYDLDNTADEDVSDGVPAKVTHELSWSPPADPELPPESDGAMPRAGTIDLSSSIDEMAGEPTVIGPPPAQFMQSSTAPTTPLPPVASVTAAPPAPVVPSPPVVPAAAATQPMPVFTVPPPAAVAAPAAAVAPPPPAVPASEPARSSESGPTVSFAPQAPATAPIDSSDAEISVSAGAAQASEAEEESAEAEELSPTEFEEVESGPTNLALTPPPAARPATSPVVAPVAPAASSPTTTAPTVATAPPPAVPRAESSPPTGVPAAPIPPPVATSGPAAAPVAARVSVPPPPPPAPSTSGPVAKATTQPPPPPAPKAAVAAAAAAAAGQPKSKKRKGKSWFEEIFDEDYLRTLPFLTPQATQREAAFIAESLGIKPGMQVLDLGCGYGRHAMELAARGHHVVGLDLSLPLLIRGADEAQRRGLNINFVHGDMRELTFDAQFDGAYCVFSTFGYFDDETNKRVAVNLARALKPGAKLVIDVLNRDYVIADLPTRVWWEGDGCVVLEEVDFNYFTSRVISNRSVVFEDGRQLEQEISMRSYSLHELGKLLHTAGFRVTEVSGGLATRGRFFGNESRQIIVVAEKRAEGAPVGGGNTPTSPPPLESK